MCGEHEIHVQKMSRLLLGIEIMEDGTQIHQP